VTNTPGHAPGPAASGWDVVGLDLHGVDLSGRNLSESWLTRANLVGAKLVGADLYRADAEGTDFSGADLSCASLVRANLDDAVLRGAVLDGADLVKASLCEVDASGASFRGTRFMGASLLGADLRGADLSYAVLRENSFKVTLDDETKVVGLSGTVFGPVRVVDRQGSEEREVGGVELEGWIRARGGDIRVLPLPGGPPRIDIDDPEVDMDAGQRLLYRGELFTGEVEERLGGAVVSRDRYVDGSGHGPSREWYVDGTPRSEATAWQGRPVGIAREWHPGGTLAAEQVFAADGLTMLEDRAWDEEGQPTRTWRAVGRDAVAAPARIDIDDHDVDMDDGERLFHKGVLYSGEVVEYQQGRMISLETYEDGIPNGPVRQWYSDGSPRAEGSMRRGFPVGESRTWHPDGTLATKRITTEDGHRPLVEFEWDESGEQIRAWQAPKGNCGDGTE
jgi:antitoxin component YwqK of YwqJK toxin-antitoxin module